MPHRLAVSFTLPLVIAFAAACGGSTYGNGAEPPPATSTAVLTATAAGQPRLPVITVTHDGGSFEVEVADVPAERTAGLSGRPALEPGSGMLFDFGTQGEHRIWMKDMLFALDLVWLDERKVVIEVMADVRPEPGTRDGQLTLYTPATPSRYVIEVAAGDAARLGLETADALDFDLTP